MVTISPHFGRIVTRTMVVEAVEATLQAWQTEYLAEAERQTDLAPGTLPTIKAWERSHRDVRKHIGSNLPCVVVQCPALSDEPVRRKAGTDAKFAVVVSVVTASQSQALTEQLADLYTASFRTLIEQNHTLGGFALGSTWIDERYDEGPTNDRDTLGFGSAIFEVEVEAVVDSYGGPSGDPLPDPYGTVRGANPVVAADGAANLITHIEGSN